MAQKYPIRDMTSENNSEYCMDFYNMLKVYILIAFFLA